MSELFPEPDADRDALSEQAGPGLDALRLHADMPYLYVQRLSPFAYLLGWAGLLPQIILLIFLVGRDPDLHEFARTLALSYAALILSFLGGIWWGMASRVTGEPPRWLWFAAVLPALIAFASFLPMAMGARDAALPPLVLGSALIISLWVDWRLCAYEIAPPGWMLLRLPLSLGLGGLTLAAAFF